jgi:pyridoxamine 5'-phosphate oxidase
MTDISELRKEYTQATLDESDLHDNPLNQFAFWFDQAVRTAGDDANAMVLSTLQPNGRPSSRVVLLKDLDQQGFVFFTNYASAKGQALAANPWASLLFFWPGLERQVRIEGHVAKISKSASDDYYRSRPLQSRVGAWASPQSQVIASRQWLADAFARYQAELGNDPVRPAHWGGYCLSPDRVEFWQGRPSRLHDRLVYTKAPDVASGWRRQRLAP